MASMGDVPDVTRYKMSLCSCHELQKNALFAFKKVKIALFAGEGLIVFLKISSASRGPTPGDSGQGIPDPRGFRSQGIPLGNQARPQRRQYHHDLHPYD